MATQVPPLRGAIYYFETSLVSQADTNIFQANPTLAAGDVVVYQDGALDGNIDTLPTAVGAGKIVAVTVSVAEMTADRIVVLFSDQAGAEWQDQEWSIHTSGQQIDDLSTVTTAQVNAEVDQALVDIRLDHLVAVADADDPVDDSIIAKIAASDGDWSGFSEATDSLEAISDAIAALSVVAFPSGANEFTYTVTDSVTGLPIEGVEVWFSTDIPGVNIVWKGDTDTFGVARDVNGQLPFLDTGTFRVWSQKSGYTFSNPDVEAVP